MNESSSSSSNSKKRKQSEENSDNEQESPIEEEEAQEDNNIEEEEPNDEEPDHVCYLCHQEIDIYSLEYSSEVYIFGEYKYYHTYCMIVGVPSDDPISIFDREQPADLL